MVKPDSARPDSARPGEKRAAPDTRLPLGAASLLSHSLSVLFRRWPTFFGLAIVPSVLLSVLQWRLSRSDLILLGGPVDGMSIPFLGITLINVAVSVIVAGFFIGLLTLAAYDTELGRPARYRVYLRTTAQVIAPISVLGLLTYIAVATGLLLFLLPGLYVAARFSVIIPAIVVERSGLSALSRSAELTAGYRWPIAGLFFVLMVIALVIRVLPGFGTRLVAGLFEPATALAITLGFEALASTALYALVGVFTALLYAQLRRLKEGLGMEELVRVFR